jgi:PAS domain S-box-containing protein
VAKSITSTDGRFHVNQAFCELVGYSEKELDDKPWREITHPDDVDLNLREVDEILAGKKETARFIKRYIHKNGSVVWVDLSTSLRRDTDGNPLYFLTTALDITERKHAEEALRQSEERFELAMLAVNDGIWDWNIAEDRLYFDPRYYTLAGYEPNEFPHTFEEWRNRIHPDDVEHCIREVNAHLAGQTKVFDIEFRFLRKDGTWMWIRGRGKSVRHDANGKVSRMIGTHTDITDRKLAEESIRQSERQMKALLTSLDDIVFEFDQDGTYLNIWTADESLLAQPKAEMLGKRVLEVMGRERGAQFSDAVKRVSAGGDPESIEYPLDVMDGWRWFMARISPILTQEHTVSVLVRDITERKRVEEQVQVQLQRMRALNEIDRAISSSMDLHLSLDILLNEVLSQLEVDAASVLLLDPTSQMLEYVAGKGYRSLAIRESRVLLGQGFAGRAGLERKTLHVPNLKATGTQFLRGELLKDEKFVEYFGVPLIAKGLLKGVLEIFHRSPLDPNLEWVNYLETLGGQAAIAIDNAQLFDGVQRSNLELIAAYDATIEGWSQAMDLRDKETEGHTLRVTEWTVKLAKKMKLSPQEITHMRRGALLHDIGKLGIPDHILHKAAALDRLEWAIMRQHPVYAFNMLQPISYLRPALDIPYCHHEKWDGSGYPRGLKGEAIPLSARIFAIVDVWDALRSDRPYRKGWAIEKIHEYLIAESGKHFDPQVVKTFMPIIEEEE